MSAQVVIPTKLSQPQSRVSNANNNVNVGVVSQKPSTPIPSRKSAAAAAQPRSFSNRFRPARKPEIQLDKNELKQKLTPLQFKVTQEKFTERAFSGEYVRLNDNGIYCCVVCGEELFSSETKYDSGCGWPAFFNTIDSDKLILQTDLSHVGGNLLLLALNQNLARTEVTCAKCGAHLGHVFDDGPKPTGKRYCVNSASLKFKKSNGEEVICDIPFNGSSCCFRSPTKTSVSLPSLQVPPPIPLPPTMVVERKDEAEIKIEAKSIAETNNNNKSNSNNNSSKDKDCKKPIQKPLLAPKPSLQDGQLKPSDMKHTNKTTKSLSPQRRSEALTNMPTTYSSIHAKRVQMNREDFFKSTPTAAASTAATAITVANPHYSNSNNNNKAKNNDNEKKLNALATTAAEATAAATTNHIDRDLNPQSTTSTSTTTNKKPVLNRIKKISGLFTADESSDESQFAGNFSSFKSDLNNNKTPINNKYSDVKSRYLDHLDSLSKKSVIKHTFGPKKSSQIIATPPTTTSSLLNKVANNSVLESDL